MIFAKNAWWMSRLSQQPSDPAYYIEDCRIPSENRNFFTTRYHQTYQNY